MKANEHIAEFVSYYCGTEEPGYAVLLVGPWGSGKTWFVLNRLKTILNRTDDSLYVSLYGMRSVEDIEQEFFRKLNPVLASKPMRFLGRLVKGAFKATLKLDLDNDGDAESSINLGVPSEGILNRIAPEKYRILVFDDLERTEIPLEVVLGYINQLVEHAGMRVLVLANEEEILQQGDRGEKYGRIKEKLIGRTFQISPQFDDALDQFLKDMPQGKEVDVLRRHKVEINRAYEDSELQNLRLLKNALSELHRIIGILDTRAVDNVPACGALVEMFLAYCFEIRSGSIVAEDLAKLGSLTMFVAAGKSENSPEISRLVAIKQKYYSLRSVGDFWPGELLKTVLGSGALPVDDINQFVLNSVHFARENPNWIRFYHGAALSDEEFQGLATVVIREWEQCAHEDVRIVLHLAGSLIHFSKLGLIPKKLKEIRREAATRLEFLAMRDCELVDSWGALDRMSAFGLMYTSQDLPEFQVLLERVALAAKRGRAQRLPAEAESLIELLRATPELFEKELTLNYLGAGKYYDLPVLKHVDVVKFANLQFEGHAVRRRSVAGVFSRRYQHDAVASKLGSELPWLKRLRIELTRRIKDKKGTVSSYVTDALVKNQLNGAISILEQSMKRLKVRGTQVE